MAGRRIALVAACALVAAACGHTVIVSPVAQRPALTHKALRQEVKAEQRNASALSGGGSSSVNVGGAAPPARKAAPGDSASTADGNCATTSDPGQGFTADRLTIGTIIPLTGALRPLGEQLLSVMKIAIETRLNQETHIPGPYSDLDWGCPTRPGVFGRYVSLKVFSLQNNTPEEALAGMRRLIDVEHVFMVRDCYLESNLMGPAVAYQNSQGVPAVYCFYSNHIPQLDPWNFAPSTNPLVSAAIHTAYLIKVMHFTRLAILSDPSQEHLSVEVIRRVAKYLGHEIPDDCVVYKHAQDASNGEDSEIAALRTCYGAAGSPDAVVTSDALNLVFGSLSATNQGWRTHWDSGPGSAWVTSLAQLCGSACAGATTDCQALPCVPWASPVKYPSVQVLQETYREHLRSYPPDVLTYGPQAITDGIGLWLAQTGPDLTREKLRDTFLSLKHWDAGIGPVLTITPQDHFGGAGVWIIHFSGTERSEVPWFADSSGRFVTLAGLGVPMSLTRV